MQVKREEWWEKTKSSVGRPWYLFPATQCVGVLGESAVQTTVSLFCTAALLIRRHQRVCRVWCGHPDFFYIFFNVF
jgi:hypothetical protein